MGSLNGDMLVNRNGQATTQITIYNYPEHLNPFYEDEQHKRLRFWKVMNKSKNSKDSNHNNSFSLSNLKNMWVLKSIRLKKKSSTLGIYKTSESPPQLRRDRYQINGLRQNNSITSSSLTLQNEPFQRNTNYRSSLQHLPVSTNSSRQDLYKNCTHSGFYRNSNNRSTIQVAGSSLRGHRRGSGTAPSYSAASVSPPARRSLNVSANPFDLDDNENEENLLSRSSSQSFSISSTLQKQTPRKKRRAPPPPSFNKSILIDSSQNINFTNNNHTQVEIDPKTEELCIREEENITALTTAITNFMESIRKSDEKDAIENTCEYHRDQSKTIESRKNDENNINLIVEMNEKHNTTSPNQEKSEDRTKMIETPKSEQKQRNLKLQPNDEFKNFNSSTKQEVADLKAEIQHNINQSEIKQTNQTSIEKQNKFEQKRSNLSPLLRYTCKNPNIDLDQSTQNMVSLADQEITSSINSIQELLQQKMNIEENQIDFSITSSKTEEDDKLGLNSQINDKKNNFDIYKEQLKTANKPPVAIKRGQKEYFTGLKMSEVDARSPRPLLPIENPLRRISIPTETKKFHDEKDCISLGSAMIKYQPRPNPRIRRLSNPNEIIDATHPPKKEGTQLYKVDNNILLLAEKMRNHLNIRENATTNCKNEEKKDDQGLPKYNEVSVDNHQPIDGNDNKNSNIILVEKIPTNIRNIKLENSEDQESFSKRNIIQKHEVYSQRNDFKQETTTGSSSMEWKNSTLAPLETNIPRERRRSVKDIIESINRSQRILNEAANKQFPLIRSDIAETNAEENLILLNQNIMLPDNGGTIANSMEMKKNNVSNLDCNQLEMKEMMKEIELYEHETKKALNADRSPVDSSANIVNGNRQSSKNLATEITEITFDKCRVSKDVCNNRESSPTSANLDWNPLPKPKRTNTFKN